jgi:hypothetical protein
MSGCPEESFAIVRVEVEAPLYPKSGRIEISNI